MNIRWRSLISLSLVILVIWWLYSEKPEPEIVLESEISSTSSTSALEITKTENIKRPSVSDEKQSEPFSVEQATGQRIQQIAKSYMQTSLYPDYSIPLSEQDWDLLNPLAFKPVKQVLDPGRGLSASLAVPAFVLFKGEDIDFSLQVEADQSLRPVQNLKLSLRSQGEELQQVALVQDDNFSGHYYGRYEFQTEAKDWPEEIQAVVNMDEILDEPQTIATSFKYVGSAGELLGVSQAYIEGAHLMIPVRLRLNNSGYYRLRMNLIGVKPVSHINNRQKLDKGEQTVLLKVHISTLKAANDAGPYRLEDFNITRLPERPGQFTAYVKADMNSMAVSGFPLSEYDDEPYQDPMQEQRKAFFQRLSP